MIEQVNGTGTGAARSTRSYPRVGELLQLDTEVGVVLYRVAKASAVGVLLRAVPRDEVQAIQADHRAAQLAFAGEVTGFACTVAATLRAHVAVRGAEVVSEAAEAASRIDEVVERMVVARRPRGFWARLLRR